MWHKCLERCSAILQRQFCFTLGGCVALPVSTFKKLKGVLDSSQAIYLARLSCFLEILECALDRYHAEIFLFCQSFWVLGVILSANILVYPQAIMVPSVNVISPTPLALMQPSITLPLPCFTVRLCTHCGSPGQVYGKHAGPHLSRTK